MKLPGPFVRLTRLFHTLVHGLYRQASQLRYQTYIDAIVPHDQRCFAFVEEASHSNLSMANEDSVYVKFILRPGQRMVNHGIRTELSMFYSYEEGDIVRYQWSARFHDGVFRTEENDLWMTVAQWHDQPDTNLGESWRKFPHRPAPVQLLCRSVGDSLRLLLRYGAMKPVDCGEFYVPKNRWIDVSATIRWSRRNAGSIHLSIRGRGFISANGANMNNGYHFFKVGNYRHPDINTLSRVDVAAISIGHLPDILARCRI